MSEQQTRAYGAESEQAVALLLGDTLPPARLGALLRAGRKRRGWKRKHVASIAHVRPDRLRAYERGDESIPPEVCARLAEVYGEDLTAHVPLRVAPPIAQGDTEEVITQYVALVGRLRGAAVGDAFPLRADDLAALSATLDIDADLIEQRIVDALGCTRAEARSLHRELLARRVVLPVAGLAAGIVALASVHAASASTAPQPAPVVAPVTTEITLATTTTLAAPLFTPPSTAAPTPTTVAGRVPEIINNVTEQHHSSTARPVAEPPAATPPAPAPAANPTPPSIPEDDTPVGVLPGETPHPPPPGM
jgi:transcriptional regulator with XRE-family HTH domain